MTKYAKQLKQYDKIEFNAEDILKYMSRLKGSRRKPTSIALEDEIIKELKTVAESRNIPYQVLMRFFIVEGLKNFGKKKAA